MQTQLADFIRDTPQGEEADAILRACVHCGFCTATCPTYQLLGDELDGPRGRIYLIKQVLEGEAASARTQIHLDRCLTCRSCETTCPSGVEYGRLLDIGRAVVETQVARPWPQRWLRRSLAAFLTRRRLFASVLGAGRMFSPLLPRQLRSKLPSRQQALDWPSGRHARKILFPGGCVQAALAPRIDAAAARVLDALAIEAVRAGGDGCCGALRHHLNDHAGALADMRRNIDAWWPLVEDGVEAIVSTASGCGVMIKDYGRLLAHDPAYAHKAARIAALTRDVSEVVADLAPRLRARLRTPIAQTLAWHAPCTLQHGQQLRGQVEALLQAAGAQVRVCADSHLCCGSAGTYSILQPQLSERLREGKLANLAATDATLIVSANIGCISHLQAGTDMPVMHWIEVIEAAL